MATGRCDGAANARPGRKQGSEGSSEVKVEQGQRRERMGNLASRPCKLTRVLLIGEKYILTLYDSSLYDSKRTRRFIKYRWPEECS